MEPQTSSADCPLRISRYSAVRGTNGTNPQTPVSYNSQEMSHKSHNSLCCNLVDILTWGSMGIDLILETASSGL